VARHGVLDEILGFFGGRAQPMMAQLAEAGKLTRKDLRELERIIDEQDTQKRVKTEKAK
jgi:predicted transcriptional regulator